MQFGFLGVNFKKAPLDIRDKVSFLVIFYHRNHLSFFSWRLRCERSSAWCFLPVTEVRFTTFMGERSLERQGGKGLYRQEIRMVDRQGIREEVRQGNWKKRGCRKV